MFGTLRSTMAGIRQRLVTLTLTGILIQMMQFLRLRGVLVLAWAIRE